VLELDRGGGLWAGGLLHAFAMHGDIEQSDGGASGTPVSSGKAMATVDGKGG